MPYRQQAHRRGDLRRPGTALATLALAGLVAAGCGSSASASKASATTTGGSAAGHAVAAVSAPRSCPGSGPNRAGLVVEVSPEKMLTRCVSFPGATISALDVLQASHVELGTQKYSFGVAVCQVDNVPAHYSTCLPSGQNYWALFVSNGRGGWTNPSAGVSDVKVAPGQWVGMRYDPPKGTPAPPPSAGKL